MDTTNQTPLTTTEQLKQWWDAKTFAGKEYCNVNDDGALIVQPFTQKTMSVLNHVTGDAVIQNLIEKFNELGKQCTELEKEWEEATDKLKLMGKINRFKEHIQQVNAIGDFQSLQERVTKFENEIQAQIENNYQEKCALVAEAEAITVEHNNWKDITDCTETVLNRLKHYFLTYKNIPGTEKPTCEITDVYGREEAYEVIRRSQEDYRNKFEG